MTFSLVARLYSMITGKNAPKWAPPTPDATSFSEFDRKLLALTDESDKITLLNARHFSIRLGKMMVAGEERAGQQTSFFPYAQFISRYRHHFLPSEKGRGATLGKRYLDSPLHRHFDGQVDCKRSEERR